MKTKSVFHLLIVGVIGVFLSGCGCFLEQTRVAETAATPAPAPAVREKATASTSSANAVERIVVLESEAKAEDQVVVLASDPGTKIVVLAFEDIHFDFDKATLKPEAQAILQRNIQVLKENPKAQVRIAGYTSASGTDGYNQKLSERRASSVKGYLIDQGLISSDRLSMIGYGERSPAMYEAAPKDLYSAAAKANMRVLFEIVVQ